MAAKIGIKLADGTFFPIMDDDFSASETLELTTVRDDQRSVQINLFKKEDESSIPSYIGSLIVEDIHEKTAGDPTIELRLSLDDKKNLSAEAIDKGSGSHQSLRVSLENFSDQSFDSLDFELNAETADIDLSTAGYSDSVESSAFSAASFYTDEEEEPDEPKKKRGIPVWLLVLLILLGIAALVLGILLLTKKGLAEDNKPAALVPEKATVVLSEPVPEPDVQEPAPVLPPDTAVTEPPVPSQSVVAEVPAQQEAVDLNQPMPQGASDQPVKEEAQQQEPVDIKEPAASIAMQKAVRYKLRWGDTLWDLSETYYRNPWLYTKIAEHNKLKNPDWVIAGTYIEIPPQ